jgi:predicted ester cyclase
MIMARTSLDNFHETATARRSDALARTFVHAINAADDAALDTVLARGFLSYAYDGVRSRTATKKYYECLRKSFSDLQLQVHENIGVLVENDMIALRTIIAGTHTGEYAGVTATGRAIQTSASHFFRVRNDRLVEHWQVIDTYQILTTIGAIPGVGAQFQKMLEVPEALDGISVEELRTPLGAACIGRRRTGEQSRAVGERVYDAAITTGVDARGENHSRATACTPHGREYVGRGWAVGRAAMPGGLAVQTHVVAEKDRVASMSVWDGTVTASGHAVDFASADFLRINGVAAEHWDTVDYVRLYQAFGLLPQHL